MVGLRIGKYLDDNGIKQSYLAEKVGIPQSQMSYICKKGKRIDSVLYYKICLALNVPFETFMEEN